MEEEQWLSAAIRVLVEAQRPLHYTNIKQLIAEKQLVSAGLKTTLEAALCKEAQSSNQRLCLVNGLPGVFSLVKSAKQPLVRTSIRPPSIAYRVYQPQLSEAAKYREKYRRLKRHVKEMIFLNAAYCDEVVRIEEKVVRVKEERRYLLRRLLQYQPHDAPVPEAVRPSTSSATPTPSLNTSSNTVVFQLLPLASVLSNASNTRPASQSIAQLLGEVDKRRKKTNYKKRTSNEDGEEVGTSGSQQRGSKKSRFNSNKRRVAPIQLDSVGRPIFPIVLGSLTIYCLGDITPLPGYYTTEHIYPVGFCSTRSYMSISGASLTCLYTCKVSDSGSAAKFEISPEDAANVTFVGTSPSDCQQQLMDAINASRGVGTVPSECDSGAEFFGLSHPVVQNLIQSYPGARKCTNYRWTKFEVSRNDAEVHVENNPAVNVDLLPYRSTVTTLTLQQQQQQQLAIESLLCEN